MEVSVTQMYECEKYRQGGRDSHQREEIVGSASSFIAALMSPGTQTRNSSIVLPPALANKFCTATDTQKHMYIQSRLPHTLYGYTHIHLVCQTHSTLIWSVELIAQSKFSQKHRGWIIFTFLKSCEIVAKCSVRQAGTHSKSGAEPSKAVCFEANTTDLSLLVQGQIAFAPSL